MTIQDFIVNSQVPSILRELEEDRISDRIFSDVVDEEKRQYVDLVQEGGGVLGIALLGYTYVLEKMGIRFYSLAGTSAGAINTMLLAALGKTSDPKSTKVLKILADQDLYAFIDGPGYAKKVIERAVEGKGMRYTPAWGVGPHNWLNFNLSDEDKVDLFERGAKAAASFLRKFDWEKYKDVRRGLLKKQEVGEPKEVAVTPENGV